MTALLLCAAAVAADKPGQRRGVKVEFVVTAPTDTPANAHLFLAGNLEAVGAWRADGLALKRRPDGRYAGAVRLPRGRTLEYKITRGTWETVEKGRRGEELANRRLDLRRDERVEITVERWAAGGGQPRLSTLTGDVRFHHDFASKHLGNARTLAVYLPPDYAKDERKRYPALYMHDGQNLFDAATSFAGVEWRADETADALIRSGRIEPLLIVGVYNNAERMEEYTPWRDERRKAGGRGGAYARFVAEEVKPFIDRTYRTRPERGATAVAGSSLGGLISLHICARYPETFGMCGVVSPALFWAEGRVLKELREEAGWTKGIRFWIDMGTREGEQIAEFGRAVEGTRELAALLKAAGREPERDYFYLEVEGGEHNEGAWAARFDRILVCFFGR